ncbi:hypothetical protein BCV69DRAFT_301081 [Microstroma glucosiphilum]|uniref:Uncharacterized protein n=1 Tax=Pseudomicrostroma glucosiphilum TaxID=1684307 RepID=A0A316U293_9BASI|nr:hypothetical protein BCV69DRAFT_301081 [Pseudomicrostroma glucosiphilum]PWN18601.1 hypothetical protein BCV69DRAFT_301081 [Pseudomicrostroma glucosiphilum]
MDDSSASALPGEPVPTNEAASEPVNLSQESMGRSPSALNDHRTGSSPASGDELFSETPLTPRQEKQLLMRDPNYVPEGWLVPLEVPYTFVEGQTLEAYAAFVVPNRYPVRMGSSDEVGGQESVAIRAFAAWDKYFTAGQSSVGGVAVPWIYKENALLPRKELPAFVKAGTAMHATVACTRTVIMEAFRLLHDPSSPPVPCLLPIRTPLRQGQACLVCAICHEECDAQGSVKPPPSEKATTPVQKKKKKRPRRKRVTPRSVVAKQRGRMEELLEEGIAWIAEWEATLGGIRDPSVSQPFLQLLRIKIEQPIGSMISSNLQAIRLAAQPEEEEGDGSSVEENISVPQEETDQEEESEPVIVDARARRMKARTSTRKRYLARWKTPSDDDDLYLPDSGNTGATSASITPRKRKSLRTFAPKTPPSAREVLLSAPLLMDVDSSSDDGEWSSTVSMSLSAIGGDEEVSDIETASGDDDVLLQNHTLPHHLQTQRRAAALDAEDINKEMMKKGDPLFPPGEEDAGSILEPMVLSPGPSVDASEYRDSEGSSIEGPFINILDRGAQQPSTPVSASPASAVATSPVRGTLAATFGVVRDAAALLVRNRAPVSQDRAQLSAEAFAEKQRRVAARGGDPDTVTNFEGDSDLE